MTCKFDLETDSKTSLDTGKCSSLAFVGLFWRYYLL